LSQIQHFVSLIQGIYNIWHFFIPHFFLFEGSIGTKSGVFPLGNEKERAVYSSYIERGGGTCRGQYQE
jgi:hypothetical protein